MPRAEFFRPDHYADAVPGKELESTVTPRIENDFSRLKTVLVAETPERVTWFNDLIENPVHAHWAELSEKIVESSSVAAAQHRAFVRILEHQGIRVIKATAPSGREGHQFLFPRDIAAVVGRQVLPAKFRNGHRQGENVALEGVVAADAMISDPTEYMLEGGDIAVYGSADQKEPKLVFVGIGPRTNTAGLERLRANFPDVEFHPVYTEEKFWEFHLDTILSFVGERAAVAFPHLLDMATLARLQAERVELVPADRSEQEYCPTNVLALESGVVIASAQSNQTNRNLRAIGIEVHEVDLSEILKQGGGPHCLALPLQRLGRR